MERIICWIRGHVLMARLVPRGDFAPMEWIIKCDRCLGELEIEV